MGLGLSNPTHIALVVVVLLLLFGAKRLPEMGRSLGLGLREFKDSVTGSGPPRAPTVTASEPPEAFAGTATALADANGRDRS